MFGSEVLEVAIGLIFIYLMLSLLTTAVVEEIARLLEMRSSTLLESLQNFLQEDSKWKKFYEHPNIAKLGKRGTKPIDDNQTNRGVLRGKGYPSYITAKTFTAVFFDVFFPPRKVNADGELEQTDSQYLTEIRKTINKLPEDHKLKKLLLGMLNDTQTDLTTFRTNLEVYYDELQERVTGWYRRKAKLIAFIIGLIVALLANADSIGITNALLRDATLRDAIVQGAADLVEENQTTNESQEETPADDEQENKISTLQSALLDTQILGWDWDSTDEANVRARPSDIGGWVFKAVGILLTAAAISLGAPFWFDILSKIMTVRSTGKPVEEETQP